MRSDRYARLARRWLPVIGAVLGVALIAALGWWGWDSLQTRQADKASAAYDRGLEALQGNNPTGADAAFLEAEKAGNAAYKSLALAQRAAIAENQGRDAQAVALFDRAAKAARDPLLADSQALKAAWLVMDTGTVADARKRLEPLAKENRPYRALAQEGLALLLLQENKPADARAILVQLQLGQDVPDSVRQRAQAAIALIDAGAIGGIPALVKAMPVRPPALPPQQPGLPGSPAQ